MPFSVSTHATPLIDLRQQWHPGERGGTSPRAGAREGASITLRGADVLTWAMRGEPDEAIGERLGLTTGTVGKHLDNTFAKLGVHSRAEALWRVTAADGLQRGMEDAWRPQDP